MKDLFFVWELSFVCACITYTITRAFIFSGLRDYYKFFVKKHFPKQSEYLCELVNCGYCFGHYVSFFLVIVYRPNLFHKWLPLDLFLTALFIAWFNGIMWNSFIILCNVRGILLNYRKNKLGEYIKSE